MSAAVELGAVGAMLHVVAVATADEVADEEGDRDDDEGGDDDGGQGSSFSGSVRGRCDITEGPRPGSEPGRSTVGIWNE
jgi:hypothetical protein